MTKTKGWSHGILFVLAIFLPIGSWGVDSGLHPRVLVDDGDRDRIRGKIASNAWAREACASLIEGLEPLLQECRKDRAALLSRLQMNWGWIDHVTVKEDGTFELHYDPTKSSDPLFKAHFTDFQMNYVGNNRQVWHSRTGSASFPTVRIPSPLPLSPSNGGAWIPPGLDEVPPYSTTGRFGLRTTSGKTEIPEDGIMVGQINRRIMSMAMNAGFLFWLTGNEEYGRLGGDLLRFFVAAVENQHPITSLKYGSVDRDGSRGVNGLLSLQTLDDAQTYATSLGYAYDFLHPVLSRTPGWTQRTENLMARFLTIFIDRGPLNNWNVIENQAVAACALAMDDRERRDFFMDFVLRTPRRNPAGYPDTGSSPVPEVVRNFIGPDGVWLETIGYGIYALNSFLPGMAVLEKNGHPVFSDHPILLKSAHVVPSRYLFPDQTYTGGGDQAGGQIGPLLEYGLWAARKTGSGEAGAIESRLTEEIESGRWNRSNAGLQGILFYEEKVGAVGAKVERPEVSGFFSEAFGRAYVRNGRDPATSLMFTSGHNVAVSHTHDDGLVMELYGAGRVLGNDPGHVAYGLPAWLQYYSCAAAHNTVLVEEAPISKGTNAALLSMEPSAEGAPLCSEIQYAALSFTNPAKGTPQARTTALVRTSTSAGYFVDLFRSSNSVLNDYLYHNLGTETVLRSPTVPLSPSREPWTADVNWKGPGYGWFTNRRTTGRNGGDFTVEFHTPRPDRAGKDVMRMWMKGAPDREYFLAEAPPSRRAGTFFEDKNMQVVVARQRSDAWMRPFVGVFEPFHGESGPSIQSIESLETRPREASGQALRVNLEGGKRDLIFLGEGGREIIGVPNGKDLSFAGTFAVVREDDASPTGLSFLYLSGDSLTWKGWSIRTTGGDAIQAALKVQGDRITVTSHQGVQVRIPADFLRSPAGGLNPRALEWSFPPGTHSIPPEKDRNK